jgi:DNA-binding CsgD family transcriptional regulator
MLQDRRSERVALDQLLKAVRAGRSQALVLRGEPGVGKSALLEYVVERAAGCRTARAAGVQSEMELPFAALHQLCAPMLDRRERLPGPQRDALGTAFGLRVGAAPDRFLVGLAALSLLSEVADDRPLVCLVDDAQWLDRASVQALAFVARRLLAESVALVFAARQSDEEQQLSGLPEMAVEGLKDSDARALLGSVIRGPLDERVRDRIVAETRGNPLALLELPRGLTPAELAGGFALPHAQGVPGRIEDTFQRRFALLPAQTRRLLLVAAADPVGEPVLVWRAAERLGIGVEAADAAESEGLVEFGARVTFRHPLVRSAVYRAASGQERREAHRALAEATDPQADPDRRAWHRAQSTRGPDEDVASELERSAGRAHARGGLAAASAFLERAAAVTLDPARRAERALAAAEAKAQAGAFDAALQLLAAAAAGPLDELRRARVDLLRGQIAYALDVASGDPPRLLLKAAKRLEPLDVNLARDTYLEAVFTVLGCHSAREPAEAARVAPRGPQPPRAADLLLDGWAAFVTERYPAGAPMLQLAVGAFRSDEVFREAGLRWLPIAVYAALVLWDDESLHVLSTRQLQLARDSGALARLPLALTQRASTHLFAGEFAAAATLIAEVEAVAEATGSRFPPSAALAHAALRGREAEASELTEVSIDDARAGRGGIGMPVIHWARSVLYNGLGRCEDALAAAQQANEHPDDVWSPLVLPELIEAAAGSGQAACAVDAFRRLAEMTRASGSDWALGIEARARALVNDGKTAEVLYRDAIDRLGRCRVALDLARAHLLFGQWLRQMRRPDAREHLRRAQQMFTGMGAGAFARRARRELLAMGVTTQERTTKAGDELTPAETRVARMARDGASNQEIATQLFVSRKTVEYHLHKVFSKLGISTRDHLDLVLPAD